MFFAPDSDGEGMVMEHVDGGDDEARSMPMMLLKKQMFTCRSDDVARVSYQAMITIDTQPLCG
jgi:hypothetical protein